MAKKIRIGIELNHVIRDINKQIAKYFQEEYDESIDLDEINYKEDVLKTVCKFQSDKERIAFMYENYPLEIFGHANQMVRTLSRDLNTWVYDLSNQEDYDIEIFFYSLNEMGISIQSTYFFLSKIGSIIRKVVFPVNLDELNEYGDVFITANPDVVNYMYDHNKKVIMTKMRFNKECRDKAVYVYKDFNEFLGDEDKLNKIVKTETQCQRSNSKCSMFWTWMKSLISFSVQKKNETLT